MTLAEHAMDRRRVILSSMRRSTNNVDEAEDLFSELLVRCVRHDARIVGGDDVKVRWLFVAAHNLCVDHCRKSRVKYRSMLSVERIVENECDELARDDWESVDSQMTVESALALLSSAEAEIMLMKALGMKDQDIADAKGVTYLTAKSRAWRARSAFREKAASVWGGNYV